MKLIIAALLVATASIFSLMMPLSAQEVTPVPEIEEGVPLVDVACEGADSVPFMVSLPETWLYVCEADHDTTEEWQTAITEMYESVSEYYSDPQNIPENVGQLHAVNVGDEDKIFPRFKLTVNVLKMPDDMPEDVTPLSIVKANFTSNASELSTTINGRPAAWTVIFNQGEASVLVLQIDPDERFILLSLLQSSESTSLWEQLSSALALVSISPRFADEPLDIEARADLESFLGDETDELPAYIKLPESVDIDADGSSSDDPTDLVNTPEATGTDEADAEATADPDSVSGAIPEGVKYSIFECLFFNEDDFTDPSISTIAAGQTLIVTLGYGSEDEADTKAFFDRQQAIMLHNGEPIDPFGVDFAPRSIGGVAQSSFGINWYWVIPDIEAGTHQFDLTIEDELYPGAFSCSLVAEP